jgi:predicted nucleic acid-binding protein
VSQLVIDEAGDGDSSAAAKRLDVLKGLSVLSVSSRAASLAKDLIAEGLLPARAAIDALHLAVGVVHGVDVLLTWNCRHLANAAMLGDIGQYVRSRGYEMPIVCTPEELMGEDGYRNEG